MRRLRFGISFLLAATAVAASLILDARDLLRPTGAAPQFKSHKTRSAGAARRC